MVLLSGGSDVGCPFVECLHEGLVFVLLVLQPVFLFLPCLLCLLSTVHPLFPYHHHLHLSNSSVVLVLNTLLVLVLLLNHPTIILIHILVYLLILFVSLYVLYCIALYVLISRLLLIVVPVCITLVLGNHNYLNYIKYKVDKIYYRSFLFEL